MGDEEKLLYSHRVETLTDRKSEKKPEVQRALCVWWRQDDLGSRFLGDATATQKLQQRRQKNCEEFYWTLEFEQDCGIFFADTSLLNKQNYENEMWISSIQYVSVTSPLNGCYLNEIIFSAVIFA